MRFVVGERTHPVLPLPPRYLGLRSFSNSSWILYKSAAESRNKDETMISKWFLVCVVFSGCFGFTRSLQHSKSSKILKTSEPIPHGIWKIAENLDAHHIGPNHSPSICHSKFDNYTVTNSLELPWYLGRTESSTSTESLRERSSEMLDPKICDYFSSTLARRPGGSGVREVLR